MSKNIDININNQRTTPLPEKIRLGSQSGIEINLSIFSAETEITEKNKFLKLYDENDNNILDEDEPIKFKSNIIQAAGDDNILDDSEFVNLFGGNIVSAEYIRTMLLTYIAEIEKESSDKIKIQNNKKEFKKNIMIYDNDGKLSETIELAKPYGIIEVINNNNNFGEITRTIYSDDKKRTIQTNLISNDYIVTDETINSRYKNGTPKKTTEIEETSEYKNKKVTNYDKNGDIISQQIYKEDNDGSKITGDTKYINSIPVITRNLMNSNGFIIEEVIDFSKHNTGTIFRSINNVNNNKTETVLSKLEYNGIDDPDKRIRQNIVTKSDGTTIESNYPSGNISASQSVIPTQITKYDLKGNIIEITKNEFKNGILIGRTVENKQTGKIKHYDFSETNMEYENSFQGTVGNCHYLETINSLRQTDGGRKALSALTSKTTEKDINGKERTVYHVTYPPMQEIKEDIMNEFNIPKENILFHDRYDITEDELIEAAKEAGINYSSGDKDVLLLELAFKKYREDAKNTIMNNPKLQSPSIYDEYKWSAGIRDGYQDGISGGNSFINRYLLTGKKSDIYVNRGTNIPTCICDMETQRITLDEFHTIEKAADIKADKSNAIRNIYDNYDEYMRLLECDLDENGKFKNYNIYASLQLALQFVNGGMVEGGHAITVKGIKGNDIILINTWDSTKDLLMSQEDFKKAVCNFGGIKFD